MTKAICLNWAECVSLHEHSFYIMVTSYDEEKYAVIYFALLYALVIPWLRVNLYYASFILAELLQPSQSFEK